MNDSLMVVDPNNKAEVDKTIKREKEYVWICTLALAIMIGF